MLMTVEEALKELAEEVKRELKQRIHQYGVNPRTGTNTLEGSDLQKSIEVTTLDNGIALQIADYWEFVSRGYPNTFHKFVENLNSWVRKKNIHFGKLTQNQIVWIVLKKIWTHGIKPRPFLVYDDEGDLTKMLPALEAYIDKWFDELFESIINELEERFN